MKKMMHEKVIKRENGRRFFIEITYHCFGDYYSVFVFYKEKNKRKRRSLIGLSETECLDYKDLFLEYVTEDEIYQAKLELWRKMKPKRK